jgi:WhiB family redox-sensing transcriptional regulator
VKKSTSLVKSITGIFVLFVLSSAYGDLNVTKEAAMNTEWMVEGKCREYPAGTFFPHDGTGVIKAQKICATCPVAQECLEYALANHIEHGIWGGASERERRRLQRARRRGLLDLRAS